MDTTRPLWPLVAVALLFVCLPPAWGVEASQKLSLAPQHRPGELSVVEVAMEVGGDLKLVSEGVAKQLPMSVVANLKYEEQLVALETSGLPKRSQRWYGEARAVIKVDKGGEKPSLDPQRRRIAVEDAPKTPPVLFCPDGPLKREELDLIDIPGNSLMVDQLLPSEPVAQGQKWKIPDDTLAKLLALDAVSWTDVESMISGTSGDVVEILAGGSASGAVGGVSTEIELKAKYRFDMRLKRVTYLALLIKEKRAIGHVGPGLDTVAKMIMKITPLAKSEHLSEKLADAPGPLTPELAQLSFLAPGRQFGFRYDRRWYVTSDDPKLAVLRLVDRGELVAQCNVSALPSATKTTPTLAGFQQDVQQSLGKNFGQFTSASEQVNDAGYKVFRLVATGMVADLPIRWVYYLLVDRNGQRVSLAFTFEQTLEERFGQADRALVSQLQLNDPPTPTTARAVAR